MHDMNAGSGSLKELTERMAHLEAQSEVLAMQNQVLAAVLKALLKSLPEEQAEQSVESVQLALETMQDELSYADSPYLDEFHDATYTFFHEKE